MQTNQDLTEGQNSDDHTAESALHDATCSVSSSAVGIRGAVISRSFPKLKLGKILPGTRLHVVPGRVGVKYAPFDVEFLRWTKGGSLWCRLDSGGETSVSSMAVDSILPNSGLNEQKLDLPK
jgi:hypothetical protein